MRIFPPLLGNFFTCSNITGKIEKRHQFKVPTGNYRYTKRERETITSSIYLIIDRIFFQKSVNI